MTSKRSNYSMFKQMAALTMLPYAIALICISSATVEAKVKITTIKVPRFVENGTQPSVVLDCPFTHDPKMDIHLVVKWFFNDDPEPIYQWITEFGTRNVPQRYEGKVNPNYAVPSNDPLQKHRALNLIRPTVELNGRYSCHVISIMSQDSAEATMIVYAKTKSIDLSTRRVIKERSTALHQTNRQPVHGSSHQQPQSDSAAAAGLSSSWLYGTDAYNGATAAAASPPSSSLKSPTTTEIECAVQNVYPLPELTIYQVLKDGLRPKSLENARLAQNVTQLPTGAFSVSVTAYIEDTELFPQAAKGGQGGGGSHGHGHGALGTSTIFECLVSQDEIRHEMRKRALYTLLDETDYDSSDAASRLHSTITQQMLLTLFICLPCIASILGSSLIWI